MNRIHYIKHWSSFAARITYTNSPRKSVHSVNNQIAGFNTLVPCFLQRKSETIFAPIRT